eukprot:TRINITY_DN306_c0_g1_i2.p2 TRINITY_DN306_c0_g1~~TRINITY_DN306_c0_g1_i2.p2  ORF type:complete len:347 (+),score=179.21 TRINITY_DN306_c0_g1_i2:50-1042(+)
MKFVFVVLAFIVVANAFVFNEHSMFASFMKEHGRSYQTSAEREHRFKVFTQNMRRIAEHNSRAHEHGFELGVNQFADWTEEEFAALNTFRARELMFADIVEPHEMHYNDPLPTSVDWRTKGVVNPVKNQGSCGSCWAFSAVSTIESAIAIATGKLHSLSEQQLVDCAGILGNEGCNGGYQTSGIEYVALNRGIESETDYPYKATDGTCKFTRSKVAGLISRSFNLTSGNETELADAVAFHGPVAIAIDASNFSFQLYKSGVYFEKKCKTAVDDLDHAVVVVGYGVTDAGVEYWIVRNSWGPTWGLQGYIWMARNRDNHCGIATLAGYPVY